MTTQMDEAGDTQMGDEMPGEASEIANEMASEITRESPENQSMKGKDHQSEKHDRKEKKSKHDKKKQEGQT